MTVEVATEITEEIAEVFATARRAASTHRGGAEMLTTILGERDPEQLLRDAVSLGGLFVALEDGSVVGFALCRYGVLEAVYVRKRARRRGIARELVNAAVSASSEPLDAYALPGDRATKSLYESFGWKARLLTMRGE